MGTSHNKGNMTQSGRERGVRKLMSINLLKRLESSVNSFVLTLTRIKQLIDHTINTIDNFKLNGLTKLDMYDVSENDFVFLYTEINFQKIDRYGIIKL